MQKPRYLLDQAGRYFVISLLGLLVDFGVLTTLTENFHISYYYSVLYGFLSGLVVNFTLSEIWVFNTPSVKNKFVRFGLFSFIGVLGLALLEVQMWLLVEVFNLNYFFAKIFSTFGVFFWNFVARRSLYSS